MFGCGFFSVFQGHTESNIYEITIPFIYRHIFCMKFNLQLFKAMLLVMNYFVILLLMRFIFNNCNNYFIKKAMHYGYLSKVYSKRGFSLGGYYYPCWAFIHTTQLKLHYVSTMFALNLSSHIYQFFPLSRSLLLTHLDVLKR